MNKWLIVVCAFALVNGCHTVSAADPIRKIARFRSSTVRTCFIRQGSDDHFDLVTVFHADVRSQGGDVSTIISTVPSRIRRPAGPYSLSQRMAITGKKVPWAHRLEGETENA
jgi:hypothetical protein